LGWGFQLQSPWFLTLLSTLFFVLAMNLFGLFEVGGSVIGLGAQRKRQGYSGSFFSGVLATLVATPCTAPFMGAALGFALSQPAAIGMLIFTFLGLGMAAPYMILSAQPALLRKLPKPGVWMIHFKRAMGVLLLLTVAWLSWVLSIQTNMTVVKHLFGALLVIALACFVWGKWGSASQERKTRNLSRVFASVLIFLSISVVCIQINFAIMARGQKILSTSKISWEEFSQEKVRKNLAEGRLVFIDFTAAWCLTCQVNERFALESPAVVQKFRELDVVMLKADWTSRDDEVTKAIRSYGRSGVPVYVLHSGRTGEQPKLLPEILTPGIVLQALDELEV